MSTTPATDTARIHDHGVLDTAPDLIPLRTLAVILGRTYAGIRQAAYRQRHGKRGPLIFDVVQPDNAWGSLYVRRADVVAWGAGT